MRLSEHPEFEQAILRAQEHLRPKGLRASFIEKDYYVTEALRLIAAGGAGRVIFKGGTSLSKGWDLIERFSEDIDLFLDPSAFTPPLGRNAIDRELSKLRVRVSMHPGLRFNRGESRTFGGFGRNDRFDFTPRFSGPGEIRPSVLVEAGIASGREPTAVVSLQSFLGKFLAESGRTLGAEDEGPFAMRLLHFRRTFVEKMFAIHGKVEAFKREGRVIGVYARHYYDLFRLADQPEVPAMLRSPEYGQIKTDYDGVSRKYFSKSYVPPPGMSFAQSDALFPSGDLEAMIARTFAEQCRILCFGTIPTWEEFKSRFGALRPLL